MLNISIPKKLLIIILFPLLLDIGEIALFDFSAKTFSAVRAYVNGESLWSKAQKDAAAALQRYIASGNESEYQEYLGFLEIPLGDREARLALEQRPPNLEKADAGFIQGGNHPEDVRAMSLFFLRFHDVPYVRDAFEVWPQADAKLVELQALGEDLHQVMQNQQRAADFAPLVTELERLNNELTALETEFSYRLGVASRVARDILVGSMLTISFVFFLLSIIVPLYFGRQIMHSIGQLKEAASAFQRGSFRHIKLKTGDEFEELGKTFNQMADQLASSYQELEMKVQERTAYLEESKRSLELEIRQRQQLEEQLRTQTETLIRVDRMKDEFLATFAHELRNPLSPIVLTLELMNEQELPDADLRESIRTIKQQTEHITRIVDELLDTTRISLGKVKLTIAPADLASVIRDLVQTMLPMIERNKQLLTVSLPPDPLMIEMDSLRIGQIIINLLSNASKFTHDGGTITLGVSKVESDVVITVTDNGIGIAPEDMRRLFDPFFQVKSENGGPRDKEGLGIGLTLSQQLAELHGGQISVHSEGIGTGSTFTLRLPITQPKSSL